MNWLHRIAVIILGTVTLSGCRSNDVRKLSPETSQSDQRLTGEFMDDYGIRYSISGSLWRQHPGTLYHIDYWDSAGQFIIARNDDSNAGDPGRWTRIDWTFFEETDFEDTEPYLWGFCLTVYDAPSSSAAASATPALRETPKNGCNGFPFSRMQRIAESD